MLKQAFPEMLDGEGDTDTIEYHAVVPSSLRRVSGISTSGR
jgi:hypothetical protein